VRTRSKVGYGNCSAGRRLMGPARVCILCFDDTLLHLLPRPLHILTPIRDHECPSAIDSSSLSELNVRTSIQTTFMFINSFTSLKNILECCAMSSLRNELTNVDLGGS